MVLNHYKILFFNRVNKQLLEYNNLYKGKRCFIIATGPSLTVEDLELLNEEICIGVNSIIKSFTKTTWRPKFLCITDNRIWPGIKNDVEMRSSEVDTIFLGHDIQTSISNCIHIKRDEIASTYLESEYFKKNAVIPKFFSFYIPNNMSKYICDGSTVVISAIQLAVYMGFEEIYLLGTDCNYQKGTNYSELTKYESIKIPDNVEEKMFSCYKRLKQQMAVKYPNVKIYNATRGGMLEVFDRIDINKLFNFKNQ